LTNRTLISAILAAAALVSSIAAARGDFRVCNNSGSRISVSLAYTDGETWISEGWWNLKSSGCETLVRGPLAAEYYYVYAMDEHGGEWKGKAFMCTRDREFRIIGREDCFVRGFDRTGQLRTQVGMIRALQEQCGRPIGILIDLQGPKLRIGTFKDRVVTVAKNHAFVFDSNPAPGDFFTMVLTLCPGVGKRLLPQLGPVTAAEARLPKASLHANC